MTSVGSNVASTSKGPIAFPWVSLTLEEQITNIKRIFQKCYREELFSSVFPNPCKEIVKELRIDPWVDLESLLHHHELYLKLLRGTTPLHWAVLMDDITMVRYILASGRMDINASAMQRRTALHYAVIGGNLNIVEDLLERKADVCKIDAFQNSTLYYMVREKDSFFGILKRILANNINMCDAQKNTALHYAARTGAIDVVTYLLDEKADVNLYNFNGCTPLHYAAKGGFSEVVICLLQHNADVNALQKYGGNPFLHFVDKIAWDIIPLPDSKVDVNLYNLNGSTPLHYAVKEGFLEVVICLLQHNADVNVLDEDGCSPLHYAAKNGAMKIVTLLAEQNTNVNALDKKGWSPLLWSLRNGQFNTSNGLIAIGADVHVKNFDKNNTLHAAIFSSGRERDMIKVVKLLREHDVDANAKNAKGYSPFFVAVDKGHTEVVKELLKSKEKIKLMEECKGQTAIQIAFDNGHEHIKRALLECDDVSRYVGDLYRDRQVYVDAANAILVGAALIASVTFASWLQPPLGYTTSYLDLVPSSSNINYVDVQHNVSLRAFWIFNTLSFYFAIATVVFGARSVLPRRQMFIKDIVVKLHHNLLVTSILLACSMFFVIIAFGIAGCIVLTPTLKFQWYMIVPTIFGGLVCLVSLGFLFKSVVEDNLRKRRKRLDLF